MIVVADPNGPTDDELESVVLLSDQTNVILKDRYRANCMISMEDHILFDHFEMGFTGKELYRESVTLRVSDALVPSRYSTGLLTLPHHTPPLITRQLRSSLP